MDTANYDRVLQSALGATTPDPLATAGRASALLAAIVKKFPGCTMDPVTHGAEFLVPDGQPPDDGQVTESAFVQAVAQQFAVSFGADAPDTVTRCAAALKNFLGAVAALGSVEQIVRAIGDLGPGAITPATAESTLVQQFMTLPSIWDGMFNATLPDVPWYEDTSDEDTEVAPAAATPTTGAGGPLSRIPGGGPWPRIGGPSDPDLGNRVHAFVQESYTDSWIGHIVTVEGRYWLLPATHVANDLDAPGIIGTLPEPQQTRARALRAALWVKLPMQPDIADLSDSLDFTSGWFGLADWGWFEIKPGTPDQIAKGIEQLELYLLKYDAELTTLTLLKGNPDPRGYAFPGMWQPPIPVCLDVKGGRIVFIVRALPGIIIYYTFNFKAFAEAASLVLLMAASAKLIGKLKDKVSRKLPGGLPDISPQMALIIVLLIAALAIVFLPEEVFAAAAAGAVAAATLAGSYASQVIDWLETLAEEMQLNLATSG